MAVVIQDVARLTMRMLMEEQQVENVFYLHNPNGWSDVTLAEAAQVASDAWVNVAGPIHFMGAQASFVEATVQDLTSETGATFTDSSNAGLNGANAGGTPLPNNVTWAVHKNTLIGGRHAKGRLYHIALRTTDLDATGQKVTLQKATDVVGGYNYFKSVFDQIDMELGFLSLKWKDDPNHPPVFVPITSFGYKDLIIDSQRRRLPGRGR